MKKHTILWADDDPDDLMLIREVLKANNHEHEVVEVNNGKEVLNYLEDKDKQGFPCLIILDMNMPVLNGKDTLMILKNNATFHAIPVVMFTTSNSEMDRMFCQKYGVEMITKPPEFSALEGAVNKILTMCHL